MQYALIDNIRREAHKGAKAICPICEADMVAKCGPRIIHHWAHRYIQKCDPWWENETEWHRDWKNLFPEECREISHLSTEGEVHRADVKTAKGIVVEFQNSPMSDQERSSREKFYKNLVWVINGEKFKNNFDVYHCLPDPSSEIAKDLVWFKSYRSKCGTINGLFWKRSENPDIQEGHGDMVWIHGINEIKEEVGKTYLGHHQYDWVRPQKTVYIDFGDEYLIRLEMYQQQESLSCIRLISKKKFIYDVNNQTSARNIGTCFFPIN